MIIDLAVLTLTGLIFEVIAMYIFLEMFGPGVVPFYMISLLICIIAVGRWNWKGLTIVPIMSIVTTLIGFTLRKIMDADGAGIYNWKMFITSTLSLASTALIIPLKKKSKSFNESKDGAITLGIVALVVLTAYVVEVLIYSILVTTNPIKYIATLAIVNVPCWAITALIMFVLRKQGVVVDAKKDLISKRKEAEIEQQYYSKYRNEILEKPTDEQNDSSNNKESGGNLR